GGIVGLALFIIGIVLVKKPKESGEWSLQPTPLEGTRERYFQMREQKEQMVGLRERLERRLEDNMSSQLEEEEQDTVPELRRQLDVMSQRIQDLEAELAEQAPPDYVSTI
ncbi:hypothetical protein MPER_08338, partial [Moniliophthora perniciosa FA553]